MTAVVKDARPGTRCPTFLAVAGGCLFVGFLVPASPAAAQEAGQGAIAGTVLDGESLEPVAGAQIFLPGTTSGTLSDPRGRYRLEAVPAGEHRLVVQLIGYRDAEQRVTVEAGQVTTADFELVQTALRLQDIVVTGVVAETPRVKLPFTVERLDPDDMPVPTSDVSTLLHGKAPGMSVTRGSGQPGSPASILLRGPTSIDASGRTQSPLIVIDGVIQSDNASLADINSLDIDHIEVVKGAAAASLYGSRAQNGVIQIRTKSGRGLSSGSFRITVRNEYGVSELDRRPQLARHHAFRMNDAGTAFVTDAGTEVTDFGELGREDVGNPVLDHEFSEEPGFEATAFRDNPFPGPVHDHVERFFDPGETWSNYVAAAARFEDASFRTSFENYGETGVVKCAECPVVNEGAPLETDEFAVEDEGYRRRNARLNVNSRAFERTLDLAASGFYSHSTQDNALAGTNLLSGLDNISPGLDLTKVDEEDGLPIEQPSPLSLAGNPLRELAVRTDIGRRQRVMGSLDVTFAPLDWFRLEGNASWDRTDFHRRFFVPKGMGARFFEEGVLEESTFREEALNASVTAGVSESFLGGDLTARFKTRWLAERQDFERLSVSGGRFAVEGVPNFSAVDRSSLSVENLETEIEALGAFLIGALDYKGRYIVDGLARRDGSSLFGTEERWNWYWRGSAAWRVAQEPWWSVGFIDELKLRGSIGTAGGRPNFFAKFETYAVTAGQVTPIELGNPRLEPEHTTERELGLDLVLWDRLGLRLTWASAATEDQLLEVPQAGHVGFESQWQNAGRIESETLEASLRGAFVDRRDLGLTVRLNLDRTTQEITRLDIPPYTPGAGGFSFNPFFVAEGEELGAMWGTDFADECADLGPLGITDCAPFAVNDEGYLVWVGEGNDFRDGIAKELWGTTGEVAGTTFGWGLPIELQAKSRACLRRKSEEECPLTTFLPLGSSTPDFHASFGTSFRWKGLAVHGLLDATVGHDILNPDLFVSEGALKDQAGKPEGLKKPIGYYDAFAQVAGGAHRGMVEDGDWLKVRELSVGYTLPEGWLRSAFGDAVDRVTLNVIGRNLFTFTGYRGYDPELGITSGVVGEALGSPALGRVAGGQYPNFRTLTASLEVVF